jgi:hypothetical protein
MDKQEAKLRQQMAGTGVEVVRIGDNLTLGMPGNVTFAFDSAKLNPQFNAVLDKSRTLKETTRPSSGRGTHRQRRQRHLQLGLSQRRATASRPICRAMA